jgi:gamma-glutamylcyclotransferase (GGCT)/AIG2-like uncharacterized protein YtfP
MSNRIRREFFGKPEKLTEINRFFLACEFKPRSALWSVLDPFAYNIKPAFIHGKLGVIGYSPEAYSILEAGAGEEPLLGYVVTITEPDTVLLLDKIKGYYGPDSFNTHVRQLVHCYTDVNKVLSAWCYVLSPAVVGVYSQIQQIEFGLWSEDEKQIALLDKITKPGD